MLRQLTLQNFLLVDTLDIGFDGGLTTITGESGAGKSILLSALGLLLGDRASPDVIRPGCQRADIAAEFDIEGLPAVQAFLEASELDTTEHSCLVRRVVTSNGRSRAFVNNIPVTTTCLRQLGEQLVDIHGQNEHQRLADRSTQLALLDDYAQVTRLAAEVRTLYREWQANLTQISTLQSTLAQAADRRDLLTYQLQELEEHGLQADEFTRLEAEHKRLSQAHQILHTLQGALQSLDELDALRHAHRSLSHLDDPSTDLASAQHTLATALGLLDDTERDLKRYESSVVIDPEALHEVEAQLNMFLDLARKHRVPALQLAEHTEQLRAQLDGIDADSSALERLQRQATTSEASFRKQAQQLSSQRRQAAPDFAAAVTQHMQLLGIREGAFSVNFSDHIGEQGIERVDFYVTTNPGFAPGPLTQIASGGEQTRIALSIQLVAAEHSALPCLILDEADVGVGGTTADTVGRILRKLGKHTQVVCITHAPQVAALGNQHLRVEKQGDATQITALDHAARVAELARMLAGADITRKTTDYATALLEEAID